MDPKDRNMNHKFSIIFEELNKLTTEKSSSEEYLISEDELQENDSIREFSEICQELNSSNEEKDVYLVFS